MFTKNIRNWRSKARQIGVLSLDLVFTLLVASLAASAAYMSSMRAADATSAALQGQTILSLQTAAHKLVMSNYTAYQASQAVTVNGVALAAGTNSGQTDNFTVAQLAAMNLGVTNSQPNGTYKGLTDASYQFSISRTPSCAATPGAADCHVSGLVCLNKPVKGYGAPVGEVDSQAIGSIFGVLGSAVGASFPGDTGRIMGADGTWTVNNPYGNVAGIVCAHFGYGAASDDYLRVMDSRDPNLQGGETVNGTIAGNAGGYSLQVNGTTNLASDTTVGSTATQTGNLTVGNSVTIGGTGTAGNACTVNGSMVWGTVAGTPTMLQCVANVWTATGTPIAVDGAPCAPDGKIAITVAGSNLVCRGGAYRQLSDMVGQGGFQSVALYGQGQAVPNPVCTGVNMTGHLIPFGVVGACAIGGGACGNNTGAFVGTIGAGNVVSIVGSDGSQAGADAQLTVGTFCATY